ncbi:MAG: hypothetical protein ACREMN_01060 [Gemmatimonadales bacterium]
MKLTAETFATQVAAALGPRLITLLLYGSAARGAPGKGGADTLLVADRMDDELFAQLAAPVRAWVRAGNPAPLLFTEREWRESADAFPIEYLDIREAHRVLVGRDPWGGIAVNSAHVRRQLEHELMGKLVHLRQVRAALWGDRKRLAAVVAPTLAGFRAMLRAVLRLAGRADTASGADDAVLRDAAAVIGFSTDGLAGDPDPAAYLQAVARTAEYVNRMERMPS